MHTSPDTVAAVRGQPNGRVSGPDASALVFTTSGDVLRGRNWRRRYIDPAVRKSGIEPLHPPLPPHDLWHSAISLWIAMGMDVKSVATRAGHSSSSFTIDRYGHLYRGQDEQALDRLDALIANSAPAPLADVHELRP